MEFKGFEVESLYWLRDYIGDEVEYCFIPVRLQWYDGQLEFFWGSPVYDPNKRGYWAYSHIGSDYTNEMVDQVWSELIQQIKPYMDLEDDYSIDRDPVHSVSVCITGTYNDPVPCSDLYLYYGDRRVMVLRNIRELMDSGDLDSDNWLDSAIAYYQNHK